MARRPQVRYFPSREGYYCQLNARQHKLASGPNDAPTGPCYLDALRKFTKLLSLSTADARKDDNTVRVVLEHYLNHVEGRRRPRTFYIRKTYFAHFCREFGEIKVSAWTHFMVDGWLAEKRKPVRTLRRTVCAAGLTAAWDYSSTP